MKKILPIIVALLLAAVAALGIAQWSQKFSAQGTPYEFVAAKKTLQPGQQVTKEDIATGSVTLPAQNSGVWDYMSKAFVSPANVGTITGRMVSSEIQAGNPITESALEPIKLETHRMDWKTNIKDNTRAIAIPVSSTRAVNGLIEVGDHVDVLVTVNVPTKDDQTQQSITVPVQMGQSSQNVKVPLGGQQRGEPMTFYLLQDVQILSVGTKTFRMDEVDQNDPLAAMAQRQSGANGITVALSPEQVLMVSFVTTIGQSEFTLALRAPDDKSLFDTVNKPPANFQELMALLGVKQ